MSTDETAIIRRFNNASDPAELASLLRNPSVEEAKALIEFLGPQKFDRMRALAFAISSERGLDVSENRNVVVLPGIMGSELNVGCGADGYNLWLNLLKIARQGLDALKLDTSGMGPNDGTTRISATGLLVKYYGEMLLALGARWNVQAYPYDWRRDLETEAVGLHQFIREKFAGQPVSIVAHSMGGLVARALWKSSPQADSGEPLLRRLIMLGTPNLGSFEVPLIFAGIQETVKKLILLTHPFLSLFNRDEARRRLLSVISSFPGIYQMSPQKGDGALELQKSTTFQKVNSDVVQGHLTRGANFLQGLESVIDSERMIYIAGYGFETVVGVDTNLPLDRLTSYWVSDAGDGKVPHDLGLLKDVPAYYVQEQHGNLPANDLVLGAVDELLRKGKTSSLPMQVPASRGLTATRRPARLDAQPDGFDFAMAAEEWATRVKGVRGEQPPLIDPEEVRLEDEILKGWVPQRSEDTHQNERSIFSSSGNPSDPGGDRSESRGIPLSLKIRLLSGDISDQKLIDQLSPSVDAIAVGIYENQRRSWAAIRMIDRSIDPTSGTVDNPGLLGDLIGRGMVKGQLAVPMLIPDPRPAKLQSGCRDIVLMGMGIGGQFGPTETRQTARELAWYLGRIGKKHLATILMGAGEGNMNPDTAMRETLTGYARALNDSRRDHTLGDRLETVTIVEFTYERVRELQNAILRHKAQIENQFNVRLDYDRLSDEKLKELDEQAIAYACQKQRKRIERRTTESGDPQQSDPPANRIIVEQVADSFWFSAMTESASIPERQVEVDPRLVDQQNEILVATNGTDEQIKAGRVLGRLLIHRDFRSLFASAAPIVMDVDTQTARIHWELIVHENPDSPDVDSRTDPAFLALQRGFTRQLRTRFAPAPEPQPSASRTLRALVVADPAPDASLAGAQQEGIEVTQILRAFNEVNIRNDRGNRIEVVSLIGPSVATRLRVLSELLIGQYDIVHYAGHCFFDEKSPQTCGWLFRAGATPDDREVLTARELRIVDRVPRFILSNACESGVMPFRPENRRSACAPAFAETFFERGVTNFICTGWPVNDRAARLFARVFYSKMLGLALDESDAGIRILEPQSLSKPDILVNAMTHAREAVRLSGGGLRTWGAYQHYGNPYSRFFLSWREGAAADGQPVPPSGNPSPTDGPPTDGPQPTAQATLPPAATNVATPVITVQVGSAEVVGQRPDTTMTSEPSQSSSATFDKINAIIFRIAPDLRRAFPNVVDVRPGYRFQDDWLTDEPAIVVVVAGDLDAVRSLLPSTIEGVPLDLWPADPLEQLQNSPSLRSMIPQIPSREFLAAGESPQILDEQERALTKYVPPTGVSLDPVEGRMTLTCHVSPDCAFPVLSDFLDGVQNSLVVAMYDFTAPHILDRVRAAIRPRDRRSKLVLDPQLALGDGGSGDNPKAEDVTEDKVRSTLKKAAGSRFEFVWAAVTNKGKVHDGIFPKAYHIKVAVRDSKAFWLSSGNWQSSNQAPLSVVPRESDRPINFGSILENYNREWHVVIEHPALAKVFEAFINSDFKQALPLQEEERGISVDTWPELLEPVAEEERKIKNFVRHPIKVIDRTIKVQPILTPDNYPGIVEKLILSAKKSIRFQNQYINIGKTIPADFSKLLKALKKKCDDPTMDVKIILRNIGDVRKMLTALKSFGFHVENKDLFRVQKSTHTKGIIVDDQKVLLGSHNWSGPGTTKNRDASLLFDDKEVAAYYASIFDHDWQNMAQPKSLGNATMPRVADSMRSLTPVGFRRVPWGAFFEDVDDL